MTGLLIPSGTYVVVSTVSVLGYLRFEQDRWYFVQRGTLQTAFVLFVRSDVTADTRQVDSTAQNGH